MITDQEKQYWVAFSCFPKLTPQRFELLFKYFPSLEVAWQVSIADLQQAGLPEKLALELDAHRQNINPEDIWQKLEQEKVQVVIIKEDCYPSLLKQIFAPPPVIYYRGLLNRTEEYNLAVVGTRSISIYGREITHAIVTELGRQGLTIVSGLALGVDALAHQVTLDNKGRTIAVLGSGLDQQNIYPSSNRYLAQKIIAEGGLLVSEFPLGTLPLKHHFPQRNRLIAGLSLGVLVIEAGETSGALITAKFALEQNREVFSVPGPIHNETCCGTNNLLKQGATPVTTAQDILESLNLQQATEYNVNREIIGETAEEKALLSLLGQEPLHVNELIRQSGLKTAQVNSTLAMMEMKGQIKNVGAMKYILAR